MKTLLIILLTFLSMPLWGQNIVTVVGNGTAGYSGDGGPAIDAELKSPDGVIFDAIGNMYICDYGNNKIRKVSTSGIITTIAGTGTAGFSGDGGLATNADLHGPNGIAVDNFGNLFISTNDNRIRKVNSLGIISTIAGNGIPGYNGDNIPATSARLTYPYVGVTDNAGNLYFSDYGNRRVRKVNTSGMISTIAGNGIAVNSGDGGPATDASIKGPAWIAFSAVGDLYIPDNIGHCVRKVNSTGIITTFAGTGIAGNSGDGGPATAAEFTYVNGITFDNSGNVYLADTHASVIRRINSTGTITTIAGISTAGYGGDGGPAIAAQFNFPIHITTNSAGNLYIADYNNHRIRKISFHPDGVNDIIKTAASTIHPNPATTTIAITTPTEIKDIVILDIMGRESAPNAIVRSKQEVILSIAHLPAGVYFVKVNGMYAGKFVKE